MKEKKKARRRQTSVPVLSPSDLAHDFVVVLVAPLNIQSLIVPVFSRTMLIHVCIDASTAANLSTSVPVPS